jgi:predicted DNA-binding transcriptional regulator AlpA
MSGNALNFNVIFALEVNLGKHLLSEYTDRNRGISRDVGEQKRRYMKIQEYLDTRQAAEFTSLSVSTLTKLRLTGGGPRYLKLGRRVVYAQATLIDWMHRRERASTSDPGVLPKAA